MPSNQINVNIKNKLCKSKVRIEWEIVVKNCEILKRIIFRCKILVVGSGTGGCSVASKLAFNYGEGKVVVLDDAEVCKLPT